MRIDSSKYSILEGTEHKTYYFKQEAVTHRLRHYRSLRLCEHREGYTNIKKITLSTSWRKCGVCVCVVETLLAVAGLNGRESLAY